MSMGSDGLGSSDRLRRPRVRVKVVPLSEESEAPPPKKASSLAPAAQEEATEEEDFVQPDAAAQAEAFVAAAESGAPFCEP